MLNSDGQIIFQFYVNFLEGSVSILSIRATRRSRHYGDGYGRMSSRHRTVKALRTSQRVRER